MRVRSTRKTTLTDLCSRSQTAAASRVERCLSWQRGQLGSLAKRRLLVPCSGWRQRHASRRAELRHLSWGAPVTHQQADPLMCQHCCQLLTVSMHCEQRVDSVSCQEAGQPHHAGSLKAGSRDSVHNRGGERSMSEPKAGPEPALTWLRCIQPIQVLMQLCRPPATPCAERQVGSSSSAGRRPWLVLPPAQLLGVGPGALGLVHLAARQRGMRVGLSGIHRRLPLRLHGGNGGSRSGGRVGSRGHEPALSGSSPRLHSTSSQPLVHGKEAQLSSLTPILLSWLHAAHDCRSALQATARRSRCPHCRSRCPHCRS